jgi:WKF domain
VNQVLEYLDQYRLHIESGSIWKFKKKHQNWIMRHLYSFPWKSDDLVILYLKTVQGQARKRLIEGAKEVIAGKDEADGETVVLRAEKILQALEG